MTAIWKLDTRYTRRKSRKIEMRVWIPEVGDVMRAPSGLLRIVRRVDIRAIDPGLRRVHITFVIRHCSWTHRPVTSYSYGELLCMGYRLTRGHIDLCMKSDEIIAREAEFPEDGERVLDCCDVKGIA